MNGANDVNIITAESGWEHSYSYGFRIGHMVVINVQLTKSSGTSTDTYIGTIKNSKYYCANNTTAIACVGRDASSNYHTASACIFSNNQRIYAASEIACKSYFICGSFYGKTYS